MEQDKNKELITIRSKTDSTWENYFNLLLIKIDLTVGNKRKPKMYFPHPSFYQDSNTFLVPPPLLPQTSQGRWEWKAIVSLQFFLSTVPPHTFSLLCPGVSPMRQSLRKYPPILAWGIGLQWGYLLHHGLFVGCRRISAPLLLLLISAHRAVPHPVFLTPHCHAVCWLFLNMLPQRPYWVG